MVTRLTGKKGPSRRKPPLKKRIGPSGLNRAAHFSSADCNHLRELDELLGSIEFLSPLPSANTVKRSCGLSLPSFARPVAFPERLWFFSFWVSLQLGMSIPVRAVSPCDGGHGAAAGFAQLLLPSAVGHLGFFGARPQGMPESSSLSWPECGRTSALQSVQFWPLGDNSSTAPKRWLGGKSLSGKRQRTSNAIIRPPQSSVTEG